MNILITSAGRRVGLLECFRTAMDQVDPRGKVIAADASNLAPALHFADDTYSLPRCDAPSFIPALIAACTEHQVDAIVPTIDTELPILAEYREELESNGATLWLSSLEAIEICADKRLTNRWLIDHGFPAVTQYSPREALEQQPEIRFPLIAKPPRGSASVGVRRLNSRIELEACRGHELVIETLAQGVEYTVHVWADVRGRALCAVPCRRIEVRGGEVSKGSTEKHDALMTLASDVVEALPGCNGPINVQIFLDAAGAMRIIEINPRFGGGYPLVDRAGAPFARWIVDPSSRPVRFYDDWLDQLTMLRYDSAVYTLPESETGKEHNPFHAASALLRTRS